MHRSHMPYPFTSKRSPNRGLGLLFLLYSAFFLLDCFSVFLVVFLLIFFFSVFFTGSGLSSSLFQTDLPKQLLEVGLSSDFFYLPPVPHEPVNAAGVCKEADHIRTRVSAGQTSFRPNNRHFFPVKIARLGPANREIARQAV